MSHAPWIVVGCGEAGARTALGMQRALARRLRRVGWFGPLPASWQTVVIDTVPWSHLDSSSQRLIPAQDYISVVDASHGEVDGKATTRVAAHEMLSGSLNVITDRLDGALSVAREGIDELRELLVRLDDYPPMVGPHPFLCIVASPHEAFGGVACLEVAETLQRLTEMRTRDIFTILTVDDDASADWATSLGFMSELMSGYFGEYAEHQRNGVPEAMDHGVPTVGSPGPILPFLMYAGRSESGRARSGSETAAELLAAAHISPDLHLDLMRVQAEWNMHQSNHRTSWSFGNCQRRDGVPIESGVLSSFGYARLSTGLEQFVDFASARLARCVHSQLTRPHPDDTTDSHVDLTRDLREWLTDARTVEEVQLWPEGNLVPEAFAPPSTDVVVVGPGEWPRLLDVVLDGSRQGSAAEDAWSALVEDACEDFLREWTGERSEDGGGQQPAYESLLRWSRRWMTRPGSPGAELEGHGVRTVLNGECRFLGAGGDAESLRKRVNDCLGEALMTASPLFEIPSVLGARVHPHAHRVSAASWTLEPLPVLKDELHEVVVGTVQERLGWGRDALDWAFSRRDTDPESICFVSRLHGAVHPALATPVMSLIRDGWESSAFSTGVMAGSWEGARVRPLDGFVPVAASVLDEMIRGWFVGRLLGRISDPDPELGIEIAYTDASGQRSARFPWPLLSSYRGRLDSPDGKLHWLPAVLESLGLAFAFAGQRPDYLEAYGQLHSLSFSGAIDTWLTTGDHGPQATRSRPQLAGGTLNERKLVLLDAVSALSLQYQSLRGQTGTDSEDEGSMVGWYGAAFPDGVSRALSPLEYTAAMIDEIPPFG